MRKDAQGAGTGASNLAARGDAVGMRDAKLLTVNQLAERTGLPAAWLRREADAGRLPCIRAGRLRMFDVTAVLKALSERQARGGAVNG